MYRITDFTEAANKNTLNNINGFTGMTIGQADSVTISSQCAVTDFVFEENDKILLNGFQSWTDTHEKGIHDIMRGTDKIPKRLIKKYEFDRYGDYSFVEYSHKKGCLHGFSYGYVRRGDVFYFVGSLNEDKGFTLIRTDSASGKIYFEKDLEGMEDYSKYAVPKEGYELRLYFAIGNEAQVFDGYFSALGIPSCEKRGINPVFGYTSWYRHYQNISEDILLSDLKGLESLNTQCDIFQIDDGYQHAVGDWLEIKPDTFPNGVSAIARTVNEHNLMPGIWLAPLVCEKNSHLYQNHKDWLLKDSQGNLVSGGCNWSGFVALDFYNEDVRNYLRKVIHTMVNDWGFKLLKMDFLYNVCLIPSHGKNRGEVMHEAMEFLLECAGDAKILGCGVPLASAFGIVHYCRIGADVSLTYDDVFYMRKIHRERTSTKNTILDSVFRRQLDGRAFLNDTDVFLLRDTNNKLSIAQKTTLAEINALTGNVIFTSDDASKYSEEAKKIFDNMLRLRQFHVTSANLDNGKLTLTVSNGKINGQRMYRI